MSLLNYGVVVGAGSGIGRETAFTFAERGSKRIMFADINEEFAKQSAEQSKRYATYPEYQAIVFTVDVTDRDEVKSLMQFTAREFGRLDFYCDCAGIPGGAPTPIHDMETEWFDKVLEVNAKGSLFVVAEASKDMLDQEEVMVGGRNGVRGIGRGTIVNLASAAGIWLLPGAVPYVASKTASIGFMQATIINLAGKGIRMNTVAPSWTQTPLIQGIFERVPGWEEKICGITPAGRVAKPEEVGEVIHCLCSNEASYVNGVTVTIDSGTTWTKNIG